MSTTGSGGSPAGHEGGTDTTSPFILIHQMGKVGSQAIAAALRAHPEIQPWQVQNTHTLNSVSFAHKRWSFSRPGRSMPPELETGEYLRENVLGTDRPIKIISPFREPVGRNVSSFFYSLDAYMPEIERDADVSTERLLDAFMARMRHDVCVGWYFQEMLEPFGIDVYSKPFPHDRGYQTFKNGNVELLIFPFDLENERKAHAIAEFLGVEPFEIGWTNEASDRADASLYKRFKADVSLPEAYLDYQYSTPYATHFFTAERLAELRETWLGDESRAAQTVPFPAAARGDVAERRLAEALGTYTLVHSMGRVGCVSMARALYAHRQIPPLGFAITHYASGDRLRRSVPWNIEQSDGGQRLLPGHVFSSLILTEWVLPLGLPTRIVTPIREPIARAVSHFFYHLPTRFPEALEGDVSDDAVLGAFLERGEHDYADRWFDQEVRIPFGIDALAEPFDIETGWSTLRSGEADHRMLIIRSDVEDDRKSSAVADFLGIQPFVVPRLNAAHEKPYAELYRRFTQHIPLPADYVERMLQTPFATRFYSEEERASMMERWTRSAATQASAA